ncbi:MAG: hypothetical protein EXR33_10675 [Betaproteobacteria bacterium]|nr:hypothetical protein [Betaproteobacteria bacterium]
MAFNGVSLDSVSSVAQSTAAQEFAKGFFSSNLGAFANPFPHSAKTAVALFSDKTTTGALDSLARSTAMPEFAKGLFGSSLSTFAEPLARSTAFDGLRPGGIRGLDTGPIEDQIWATARIEKSDNNSTGAILSFDLVDALSPGLALMWTGATVSLFSENPERARHVAASGRELLRHVLELFAPDNAVLAWIVRPDYLHDKRPTRRARLHFAISRQSDSLDSGQQDLVKEFVELYSELSGLSHVKAPRLPVDRGIDLLQRVRAVLTKLILSRRP